jgi:site-specific DNA-methyltransferase (adenine-specific)
VLDPFCGCGTATVAAHRLGRQWIGIDVTYLAVDLMRQRLVDTFPDDFPDGVHIDGEPADEAAALALAERDKYQFQFWIVAKLGATARGGVNRKGRDQGIDGVTTFPERDPNNPDDTTLDHKQVIISVKGGGTSVRDVRDLVGTVEREHAAIGVLVTARTPTRDMVNEANAAGLYHSTWDGSAYPKIQILTAGQIVQGQRIDMPSQRGMRQYQQAPRARRGTQGRMEL